MFFPTDSSYSCVFQLRKGIKGKREDAGQKEATDIIESDSAEPRVRGGHSLNETAENCRLCFLEMEWHSTVGGLSLAQITFHVQFFV